MKEKRFYLVNVDNTELNVVNCSDEDFITEAEKQGKVYTESGFVEAFNNEYVNSFADQLRIIEV